MNTRGRGYIYYEQNVPFSGDRINEIMKKHNIKPENTTFFMSEETSTKGIFMLKVCFIEI